MDGGEGYGTARTMDFGLGAFALGGPSSPVELDALLDDHRDIVLDIAARYASPSADADALVRAGIEGLLEAVARFDASCGRFSDFAAWWIRRRIVRRAAR